jgi:hypothetical protein
MHLATERFWKCYEELPEATRAVAKKNFGLLRADPAHPSLHFKKAGRFWSIRIGLGHRALAIRDGEDFVWVWIGPHDGYKRMIKGGG